MAANLLIGFVIVSMIPTRSLVFAQHNSASAWVVRTIQTSQYNIDEPMGLAFSPAANDFLIWDSSGEVNALCMYEEPKGSLKLEESVENPLNVAFDNSTDSLFSLNGVRSQLARINVSRSGLPTGAVTRFNIQALGLNDAQGITFDPNSGWLFILDAQEKQIIAMHPNAASRFEAETAVQEGRVRRIELGIAESEHLQKSAFNPQTRHLVVANPDQQKLYELSEEG